MNTHLNDSLIRRCASVALAVVLSACSPSEQAPPETSSAPAPAAPATEPAAPATEPAAPALDALSAALAAQPAAAQARYVYRHPRETLEFFGIEPGMRVLEALPGGGWYSKILLPYLGEEGALVGVDYAPEMFPLFGFFSEERLKAKETWVEDWSAEARAWFDEPVAAIEAFQFGRMPADFEGELDAALLIRVLHNMARFESQGGFLTGALAEIHRALKPGGLLGVVQHRAPDDAADDWADGSAGYLKQSFVIDAMTAAGFEFVAESDINANPKDRPTSEDIVWRLPPSLSGSDDDPERAAAMQAIGESNRMTLLFRKPA